MNPKFHSVKILVTGDERAANQLHDAASTGEQGLLPRFGDWLGEAVFDLVHGRIQQVAAFDDPPF